MEPNVPEDVARLEAIKARLIDPRTVSKNNDQVGRAETAQAIWDAKAARSAVGIQAAGQEQALQKESTGIRAVLDKVRGLIRGPDATKTAQIEARLASLKAEYADLPDPHDLLNAFYEKAAEAPLSVEEKKELLKPEVLAALSTEEYIALWRRLNPYYFAHVTRHGFRDHVGNLSHSAGVGNFFDGLGGILRDEKMLRSPFGAVGLKSLEPESIERFLAYNAGLSHRYDIDQATTEDEIDEIIRSILDESMANAPKYPDATAVHLSSNYPLDRYYGAEEGNEIFMIFPADFVASQFTWGVNHDYAQDLTRQGSNHYSPIDSMENDVFVWPATFHNPGIPIDAGIVFLPRNTVVDPDTGSRYASEVEMTDGVEVRKRVRADSVIDEFNEFVERAGYDGTIGVGIGESYSKFCEVFTDEALRNIGFTNGAIANFKSAISGGSSIENAFNRSNAMWRLADNPISSQEYWETYFSLHPELRPKHIVYYEGHYGHYTQEEVTRFLRREKIDAADTSSRDGVLLGFEDNYAGVAQSTSMWENRTGNPWFGHDELRDALKEHALAKLRVRNQANNS